MKTTRDDKAVRQDVTDELDFDPGIDAAHLGVAVSEGVVMLSGHVPTYSEKVRIEEAVWHVRGVKAIVDEIEVRPTDTHKTSDEEISKRAVNQITWSTVVPDGAVHVSVRNGFATLSGAVEWQYQKKAAYEAVRGLAGVRGVSNLIDVKPAASATDIKKRIEDALRRSVEVEAGAVRIAVEDGVVTLEGRIRAWPDRAIIERAAWSAPGVKAVKDKLTL